MPCKHRKNVLQWGAFTEISGKTVMNQKAGIEMGRYKCCIFDLDGTLVNSIHALTYCTNLALERFGLGPLSEDQMKEIVGDGYRTQMRRSLLAGGDTKLLHYEEILPVYLEIFSKNCLYEMHAYDGIMELLAFLKSRGIRIAVVSNKPHAQAVDTVEAVFGKGYFDVIIGEREGIPKKPDPAGALAAAESLGASPDACMYFGDTNTDMQTGKNAHMTTVGVLWGFRTEKELKEYEPDFLIRKPQDIIKEF